jgi:hypothetical protein
MKNWIKTVIAISAGVAAAGAVPALADDDDYRGRDRDGHERDDDHRARDRYGDRRDDDRRDRYDDRRSDDRRYEDRRYAGARPDICRVDHDHRIHHRDYYNYYPRDRYYNADPTFSLSFSFGDRGYYDRSGRYYDRPYYDNRGYRDYGRIIRRDSVGIRGYRADALIVEEVFQGRRGADLVCTVTARGPDSRYVPYGRLRSIAAHECSHRAQIRIYA